MMNEQKKSSPMNLDYLKHVRDYMITFSEYLGKNDPNSKMFQYALRYLPCLNEGRQVQFAVAMNMFSENPLFGNGPGAISVLKNFGNNSFSSFG